MLKPLGYEGNSAGAKQLLEDLLLWRKEEISTLNAAHFSQIEELLSNKSKVDLFQGKRKTITNTVYVIDEHKSIDAEDGISLAEKDEHSNQWVSIHILDCLYYIPYDSPLLLRANNQVSSFYLFGQRIPLFPREITKLLSFTNQKETTEFKTITFSALIDQNTGSILKYRIYPSIISKKIIKILPKSEGNTLISKLQATGENSGEKTGAGGNPSPQDLEFFELYKNYEKFAKYLPNVESSMDKILFSKQNNKLLIRKSTYGKCFDLVRGYMFLAFTITASIGQFNGIPLFYRQCSNPYLSAFPSSFPDETEAKESVYPTSHIYTQQYIYIQYNHADFPLNFSLTAPCTSPFRRIFDYYNISQIQFLILNEPLISQHTLQHLLQFSNKKTSVRSFFTPFSPPSIPFHHYFPY